MYAGLMEFDTWEALDEGVGFGAWYGGVKRRAHKIVEEIAAELDIPGPKSNAELLTKVPKSGALPAEGGPQVTESRGGSASPRRNSWAMGETRQVSFAPGTAPGSPPRGGLAPHPPTLHHGPEGGGSCSQLSRLGPGGGGGDGSARGRLTRPRTAEVAAAHPPTQQQQQQQQRGSLSGRASTSGCSTLAGRASLSGGAARPSCSGVGGRVSVSGAASAIAAVAAGRVSTSGSSTFGGRASLSFELILI